MKANTSTLRPLTLLENFSKRLSLPRMSRPHSVDFGKKNRNSYEISIGSRGWKRTSKKIENRPYMPPELIYDIVEIVIADCIQERALYHVDLKVITKLIRNLSLVSKTFLNATASAFSKYIIEEIQEDTARVINPDYYPLEPGYAMLYQPWQPIYVLAKVFTLDLVKSIHQPPGMRCKNGVRANVVFRAWDPISLATLLLIWNSQAAQGMNVPRKSIRLVICFADSDLGSTEDKVLQRALSRCRSIDFESIHIHLPKLSFSMEDAFALRDNFKVQPANWTISESGNKYIDAQYFFE